MKESHAVVVVHEWVVVIVVVVIVVVGNVGVGGRRVQLIVLVLARQGSQVKQNPRLLPTDSCWQSRGIGNEHGTVSWVTGGDDGGRRQVPRPQQGHLVRIQDAVTGLRQRPQPPRRPVDLSSHGPVLGNALGGFEHVPFFDAQKVAEGRTVPDRLRGRGTRFVVGVAGRRAAQQVQRLHDGGFQHGLDGFFRAVGKGFHVVRAVLPMCVGGVCECSVSVVCAKVEAMIGQSGEKGRVR